jgi:hypothetical protein
MSGPAEDEVRSSSADWWPTVQTFHVQATPLSKVVRFKLNPVLAHAGSAAGVRDLCGSWRFCDTRVSLSRSQPASFTAFRAFTWNKPFLSSFIPFDLDLLLLPFPPLSLSLSSMDKECSKAPLSVVLHLQHSPVPFECGSSQSFATCLAYCVPCLLVVPCQICQDLAFVGLCTCVCFCMSVCKCVRACVRASARECVCAYVRASLSHTLFAACSLAFCSVYVRP